MHEATPILPPQAQPEPTKTTPLWLVFICFGLVGILCAYLFTEKAQNLTRALWSGGLSASAVGALLWYLYPPGAWHRAVLMGALAGLLVHLLLWPLYVYIGVFTGGTWASESPADRAPEAILWLMIFGVGLSQLTIPIGAATGLLVHFATSLFVPKSDQSGA